MKTCPVCSATFEPHNGNQRYCSRKCWRKRLRQLKRQYYHSSAQKFVPTERACIICGRKFMPTNRRNICCSEECSKRNAYKKSRQWRLAHSPAPPETACKVCGKTFKPRDRRQKCCSAECSGSYQRDAQRRFYQLHRAKCSPLMFVCTNCGKSFHPTSPAQRFCCKSCATTYSQTRAKERRKPLKTLEQWQAEAAACGLSYGQYRLQVERFGKSFEELKL